MDPVSTALTVGGTIFSAIGQIQAGNAAYANAKAQQQALDYQAQQAEVAAGQERAASQRRAKEASRQANLRSSRAQALVAAGGGSTLDPSIVNIMGDIAAEGVYESDLEMYEGEDRARAYEQDASLRRYEGQMAKRAGKQARKQGFMSAGATILKGGLSIYDKYGTEKWANGDPFRYG